VLAKCFKAILVLESDKFDLSIEILNEAKAIVEKEKMDDQTK